VPPHHRRSADALRHRAERAIVYYFKDPGPGFDPKSPGLVATDADPLSHLAARDAQGQRAGGFGMLRTSRLVDEVHYSEKANEVFLVKHLDKLEPIGTDTPAAATSSV
jgi:anti-sigma regulatory factor (Ser/Thr protein kinase)